jgi:L-proline 4-hydroxylase
MERSVGVGEHEAGTGIGSLTAEQRRFYADRGYLFLERVFGAEDVDAIRAALPAVFAEESPRRVLERDGRTVRSVYGSHAHSPLFGRLVRHPALLNPARQLLGGDVHVYQFKINAKAAFRGDVWEWHQDFIFWHHEDGLPAPHVATFSLFLDDVTEFNGPLIVIPGSHGAGMIDIRAGDIPQGYEGSPAWISNLTADLKYSLSPPVLAGLVRRHGMVAPKGPAGSVLVFDGNLAHGSNANMSPFDRTILLVTYNRVDNRPGDMAYPRPEFLASRDCTPLRPLEGARPTLAAG